jgi:hypothetical protein
MNVVLADMDMLRQGGAVYLISNMMDWNGCLLS